MGNSVAKHQGRDRPRKKNVHWKTAGRCYFVESRPKQLNVTILCAVKIFTVLSDNKWSRSSERPAREIFLDLFHVSRSSVLAGFTSFSPLCLVHALQFNCNFVCGRHHPIAEFISLPL